MSKTYFSNPTIENPLLKTDNNMEFVFNNQQHSEIDKSMANAIRRTILSEYPTYSFNSEPYHNCDISITENTSSLHNEFIAHRLGLIPINISEIPNYFDGKYTFEINKENNTNEPISITTEDINIIYIDTQTKLDMHVRNKVFPADKVSGDYILICKLRPNEVFRCTAKASRNIGKTHASYSPVSKMVYYNERDPVKVEQKLSEKIESEMSNPENTFTSEEISHKFNIFEADRCFYTDDTGEPNVFHFEVETIGSESNQMIIYNSFGIIIKKMQRFIKAIESKNTEEVEIFYPETMNTNVIDTMIKFDTHTIGNLLQSYLLKYFLNNEISLVGYKVPHPLEVKCIVRVEPKHNHPDQEDNINFVKDLMINVSRRIINILTDCRKDWVKYTHIKPEIEEMLAVGEDKAD